MIDVDLGLRKNGPDNPSAIFYLCGMGKYSIYSNNLHNEDYLRRNPEWQDVLWGYDI